MVTPPDRSPVFDAVPDACLVLDRDLRMVDANPAHLRMLGTTLPELLGRRIAEVFPVNPEDPRAAARLEAATQQVLDTGEVVFLGVVRYDLPAAAPEGYDHRCWSVTLTPVHAGPGAPDPDEVRYVLQRARDVTAVHRDLLRALDLLRTHTDVAPERVQALLEGDADAASTAELSRALAAEVDQLHEAMASRAGIEQAKGIVMGARGCTADEAFATLVRTSQHTNRKLRDVAHEVVTDGLAVDAR